MEIPFGKKIICIRSRSDISFHRLLQNSKVSGIEYTLKLLKVVEQIQSLIQASSYFSESVLPVYSSILLNDYTGTGPGYFISTCNDKAVHTTTDHCRYRQCIGVIAAAMHYCLLMDCLP